MSPDAAERKSPLTARVRSVQLTSSISSRSSCASTSSTECFAISSWRRKSLSSRSPRQSRFTAAPFSRTTTMWS